MGKGILKNRELDILKNRELDILKNTGWDILKDTGLDIFLPYKKKDWVEIVRRNAEKKNLEKCLMNTIFQGREKRMGKIEGIKI